MLKKIFAQKLHRWLDNAQETLGDSKRDRVVHQVTQTCHSLQATREAFTDALSRFQSVISVPETALAHKYHVLQRQYQTCCDKAETVHQRIAAIESVSAALFAEWEQELNDYHDRTLRNHSKRQLTLAKQQYARLIKALRKAERKIQPVLVVFNDQVLHLKHNLNARAIAALQHEFIDISVDIAQLLQTMEVIITEANHFVSVLGIVQPTEHKKLPQLK